MFGSLVRWIGVRGERSESRVSQFVPRLDSLENRVTPGGSPGGVLRGSTPGSETVVVQRNAGEEIPQTLTTPSVGTVSMYGAKRGIASGTNAEVLADLDHGVWVDGQLPHGIEVSPFGGASGGVL